MSGSQEVSKVKDVLALEVYRAPRSVVTRLRLKGISDSVLWEMDLPSASRTSIVISIACSSEERKT